MPRKATGGFEVREDASGRPYYLGRVRLGDGSREWVYPPDGMSEARARDWVASIQESETRDGLLLARKRGEHEKIAAAGENFEGYVGRWIADRKLRGVSAVDTDAGYLKKHVVPILGAFPMTAIGKEQIEDVRDSLDTKVRAGAFKWKTAHNIWGLVSKLFSDAWTAKSRALRVLESDPTVGVLPPDKGDDTAKTYLYPREFLQLVECELVPLRWRRFFALAVYLYARAGEINALQFGNGIDLEARLVEITEQVDRRTTKRGGTKTGITRRLPIEPNLFPLLELIHEEAGDGGRLGSIRENDRKLARALRHCMTIAGLNRRALHHRTPTSVPLTFHDLRATGITWCAARGDAPFVLMQRAGHKSLATTQEYIREAENLRDGLGEVFPPLPPALLVRASVRARFDTEQIRSPAKDARKRVEAPGIENVSGQPMRPISRDKLESSSGVQPGSPEANPMVAGSFGPGSGQEKKTGEGASSRRRRNASSVARSSPGARAGGRR